MTPEKEPPRCPFCERLVKYNEKNVTCSNPHCKFHNGGCSRQAFDLGVVHMFVRFYKLYPRKKNPNGSLRAWLKLCPDKKLYSIIMTHITKSIEHSKQWKNKDYIPYPSTYINGFMWEDEVDIPKDQGINRPPVRLKPTKPPASQEFVQSIFDKYRENKKRKGGDV